MGGVLIQELWCDEYYKGKTEAREESFLVGLRSPQVTLK